MLIFHENLQHVPKDDLLHPQVARIHFIPTSRFHDVTDAYLVTIQEILALLDSLIGSFEKQVQFKNSIQYFPQLSVPTSVTKIYIAWFQILGGKSRWRQSSHNELRSPRRNIRWIWMRV